MAGSSAQTFTVAMDGATFLPIPLPPKSIIRQLTFKSRLNLALEYKYRTGDPTEVELARGDVYNIDEVKWGPYASIFVKGDATDTIDGDFWV